MVAAQGFVEYGGLASLQGTVREAVSTVRDWFGDLSPNQWTFLVIGAVILWLVFVRRSRH